MKGQFMALTAVIVSVMVLSITGMMTEFQNQNYPQDELGKTLDTINEETGKINVYNPEERRNFIQFVESVPGYSSQTEYLSTEQCFDVTIQSSDSQASLDCIGGSNAETEEVRLISIGYNARDSEGGNAPIPPRESDADYGGVFDAENGRKLHDGSRSYSMSVYDLDTDSFQYHRTYDVFESTDEAERMAQDIEDLGNDRSKIVLITTQDEPQTNRLHGDLPSEMYDLGASENVFGASDNQFKYRSAYLLVGRPGLGQGRAYIEKYAGEEDRGPDNWVDATFKLS